MINHILLIIRKAVFTLKKNIYISSNAGRTFAMIGAKSLKILWRLKHQYVIIQSSDGAPNGTNSVAKGGRPTRKHIKLYHSTDILGIE